MTTTALIIIYMYTYIYISQYFTIMWSHTIYSVFMQSLLEIHIPFLGFLVISVFKTYLVRLSPRLFASPWTPSRWKKNSFWVQRRTGLGVTAGSCVCLRKRRVGCVCVPCAQPLHVSAHYSPGGRELRASSFQSPHSHSCFPMPAAGTCSLLLISLCLDSCVLLFS